MSFVRGLAIVLLASVSSVNAFDYKGYNTRSCTATDAKCAGAPGKPYIKYAPCCDASKACAPKPNPAAGEWGRFCIDKPMSDGPKCYNSNERCMGAPGMPYVEYKPCCTAGETCQKVSGEWGGFCKPAGSIPSAPSYTKPPSYGYSGKKCYDTGVRCMGEKGYPYVPYLGCCKAEDSCVKSTTTWGSVCTPPTPKTPYVPKSYYGKTTPPVTTTRMPYAPKSYYGKSKPTPSSPILAKFPELGSSFGCNSGSEDPAEPSVQDPFSPVGEQQVLEMSIPVTVCNPTVLTFTKADAEALCAAFISRISSEDPNAECRYISVSATSGSRIAESDDLSVAERQFGGIIIIIQILIASRFVLIRILVILGPIILFLGGFITPIATSTSDA